MQQKYVLGLAGLVIAGATFWGVGAVKAETSTTGTSSTISKMAQAIADKFHLNATEVQSTMTMQHQKMWQDHEAQIKMKLDQAVKDKKLTQAQEDVLLEKMVQRHEDKSTMRADRQGLRQYVQDQKIDLKSILGQGMGFGHHRED